MIEGLEHKGDEHKCNVCQTDFTDDEGGMLGYLGLIPVAFCPYCYAGICDMVEQLDDREWEGLTDEELPPLVGDNGKYMELQQVRRFYKYIEAKLKEKNT